MIDATIRLRRAINLADLSLLKRVVKNNPQHLRNPDLSDNGNTSLHLAAKLGLPEIADFLISVGHEDAGISRNAHAETPLHLAITSLHPGGAAVAHLIASRFPRCIPFKNDEGIDAIMLASHSSLSSPPTSTQFLTSASTAFIDAHTNPPNNTTTTGPIKHPPSTAITDDDLLPHLLAQHPYPLPLPLEATDSAGNTPLHHASAWGNLKAIRTLLEHGADASARNNWSWTPVAYSASVAAEVYFRGLITARDKAMGISGTGAGGREGGVGTMGSPRVGAAAATRERGGSGGDASGGSRGNSGGDGAAGRVRGGSGGDSQQGAINRIRGESGGDGGSSGSSGNKTRGGSGGETQATRMRGGSGGRTGGVRMVSAEGVGRDMSSPEALRAEGRIRQAIVDAGMNLDR